METNRAAGKSVANHKSDAFTVDLDDEDQVTTAVRRAVANALRTHKENGWYIVGYENGQIVRVEPEDIVVPEVTD